MNDEAQHQQMGLRLRAAREQSGLTQEAVAKRLDLQRPTISEIEAGRRKVKANELAAFSEIYNVSIPWLVSEEKGKPDKLEMAARGLAKLKPEDLDKVLNLLSSLRDPPSST